MDPQLDVLVSLQLEAAWFLNYSCKCKGLRFGISLGYLAKILKCLDDNNDKD